MTKDEYDTSTGNFLARLELDNIQNEWFAPTEFPDLRNHKTIAVDLETRDPNLTTLGPGWARGDGYVIGVAVAAGDYAAYFPVRHQNGPNMDPKMVFKWLSDQMATPRIDKVMHNAQYDLGWMLHEGVEVQGTVIDTLLAAPLVDENRFSYSLDNLLREYLSLRKDEKILRLGAEEWGVDPKKDMWRLPAKYVGGYAEQDAARTLKLWEYLKTRLETADLWSIFNLETRVQPAAFNMRRKGVRVDLDAAERSKKELKAVSSKLHKVIKDECGLTIDVWAASSVQKIFDSLSLSYPRTEAGAPSFTKQFLQAQEHPVAKAIVSLREADKADSTFIESILRYEHKGRIHGEFHQLRSDDGGTVTGRFSSSNPNMQQIPARDPWVKRLIRGLFLPEEGQKWGSFDYSSQEPRLLVHFAACLPDQIRHPMVDDIVAQYHAGDADLHQLVADMAGISRKAAKTVNLGIMYGMGKAKLADQLGLSLEEAVDLMDRYGQNVPFVRGLADLASKQAERNGQVRTVLGRLCHFDMWEPSGFGYNKPMKYEEAQKAYGTLGRSLRRAFTYKALNRVIQGSAADQNKLAMAECFEAGLAPMLTVHDELCFSIENDDQVKQITEIMENGLKLKVPSKVDVALVNNWGEVD